MIKNLKKYYKAPELGSIKLDKSIVLFTESPPDHPTSAAPIDRDVPSFDSPTAAPSYSGTPFGGSRPDYGDM